jgi:hypothetical protein
VAGAGISFPTDLEKYMSAPAIKSWDFGNRPDQSRKEAAPFHSEFSYADNE